MTEIHGFEKVDVRGIPELKTKADLYRHAKTACQHLSLGNDEENKVFGINFRTPPYHSAGVAHILEHSVFCHSRKFPVKKPSYHIEYSTSRSPVSDKWLYVDPECPMTFLT
jgi:presequence protease